MTKVLDFRGAKINYLDKGTGVPLVFLHGYLESIDIWKPFVDRFSTQYRVICIDLPGHGKSDILPNSYTLDKVAEVIRFILDALFIDRCILIGHSMGGYITMAFVENHADRLLGYCLFHSTPFADSEEKKKSREREIELVKEGQKRLIIEAGIANRFADENIIRMKEEIEFAKELAENTPDEGIIAALMGMKERPDRSHILENSPVPCLWILGKLDNYINYENIIKNSKNYKNVEIFLLENSGHMGFIEEPDEAEYKLKDFINRCTRR